MALKPEDVLTIHCVEAFNYLYPKRILIHIANERKTEKKQVGGRWISVEGNLLKRKGVRPGVSDLFIPEPTKKAPGLWIELKATTLKVVDGKIVGKRKGTVSPEQKDWLKEMDERGYGTAVAYTVEEFINICKEYFNA